MLTKTPASPAATLHTETSQNEAKPCTRTLLTVKQFCHQNPAFSEGSLRWLLFHRRTNGLDRAVFKVGRRVLIDVDEFYLWLDQQNECFSMPKRKEDFK
jgi:hypothetical protein